ncbi:MAG: dihydroorotate dehydrogenase-like protein [Bacteroidales bacterium]|nr:dihydroorotate dehydrogenase-like protein [Bacteroidales bacterium]
MLETNYLGIKLKNPIIIGSSGLTGKESSILELEKHGAGAIVLKSLFEEDIYTDFTREAGKGKRSDEELDYLDVKVKQQHLAEYTDLIRSVKSKLEIPVMASINCTTSHEWGYFAGEINRAGADALELNIYEVPEIKQSGKDIEQRHFEIIRNVLRKINIPLTVKISPYHSSPGYFCSELKKMGVSGVTLFNRFLGPNFNPQTFEFEKNNLYSSPDEYFNTLRWIGILDEKIKIHLCASTGIHDSTTIMKMLAAGASAVQLVSVVYKHGPEIISRMEAEIKEFLKSAGFESIKAYRKEADKQLKRENFTRSQFLRLKKFT